MRTKHFLTALCLPLAFAACTNDDFVNESNTLEGRGMIDVTLTAARSSYGADTKMSIDDKNQFVWEKDADMIGAAIVDGAKAGKINEDNSIYINYPFTADADGNVSTFSGKSAMTQGLYFFYYEYQDVLNRQGLPMGKPNQVYDAASGKTALQQAAQYMRMVSPIVNLNDGLKYKDAQTYNLNLKFANLYTVVQVNIKSANIPEGTTPKVTKIKLDAKASDGETPLFKVNAAIDMNEVAKAGIVTLDKGQIKTDEQTAALAELEKMIADNGAIYSENQPTLDKNGDPQTANGGAFELNVKGDVVLDAAKATSLYILVPKGTYTHLKLTVETSEGSYNRDIKSADGIELANKIQPISADLNFAKDGTGNVNVPQEFEIASAEDWASAVKFMTDHAVSYLNKNTSFKLTKDIAIESLPVFNLTIKGGKTLTLKKDYTISEENKEQFTFDNVNLAVANGATLTLKADPQAKLINYGMLNVSADVTISKGLVNGKTKDSKVPAYAGTVNVAKGKTLTIKAEALTNTNGTVAVAEDAALDIQISSTNKANGKIEVKGVLKSTTPPASSTVASASESTETPASLVWTNKGTIDNFGSLQAKIENAGLFIIEKGSSAKGNNTESSADFASKISGGTVEVKDVTTFAALQKTDNKYGFDDAEGKKPKVTVRVANQGDYEKADEEGIGITDITLTSGEWTIVDRSVTVDAAGKKVAAPKWAEGLILEGATLVVVITDAVNKNISTSGKSTSTVKADAARTINGSVTVGAGSTLVVENMITVNSKEVSEKYATINGTLNVMPGAKMYFNTATVAEDATLKVKGDTKSNSEAGVFGAKDSFKNDGFVESEAGTSDDEVPGKVSQPTNGATGTFKGNAATDIFTTVAPPSQE